MARLIVEACTAESAFVDVDQSVMVDVSVSRAANGTSVTGLKSENFRVASQFGFIKDFKVFSGEMKWEPDDVELSGCYQIQIIITESSENKFTKGQRYVFGIQARTFTHGQVLDQGQTILSVISEGV